MTEIPKEALDSYGWLVAYMDAGFTRQEAMQILCRPHVNLYPATYPPEVMEFWERQNALATKILIDMDDD